MVRLFLVGLVGLASVGLSFKGGLAAGKEPPPLIPFVLPWDDHGAGPTNVSAWLDKPAGAHGPVVVKDGHLFDGRKRLRLLGVNVAFGANFPKHDDASKVAARMAKFGINCVRFHHMDMQTTPSGVFSKDGCTLDPSQLDKLDFFIAELKKNGIYTDLNLHVSRTYPDRPKWEGMPGFFKGVDNFDPSMIAMQRQYARDLLTHRNPYTKTRYIDEPAVALIEINNENALIQDWWGGRLDAMPSVYKDELARQWNAWLSAKYPDAESLRRAWGAFETPLGAEILANADFSQGLKGWTLEQHEGAKASAKVEPNGPGKKPALTIEVQQPGKESWHVQCNHPGIRLEGDRPYTLSFLAKSDQDRRIIVSAMQAHPPWTTLWSAPVSLTTIWQEYRFTFQPSAGDTRGRIGFGGLGSEVARYQLADVSLKAGGVLGFRPGEAYGRIEFVRKAEFSARTAEGQRDWVRFLCDVETRYWTGMARFLKDDLKAGALIVGTQMGWSPPQVQANLDVIDSHAYWQHPHFPGKPWDPDNWTVKNLPMAGLSGGGTLPNLGLARVQGKPFLCTEYNHAAPNTYSSEAFLLLATYAALQDWDGIFPFAYSHRLDGWDEGRIPSFFDIDQHPTKMATLPPAAAIFLRGDVPPAPMASFARPRSEQLIEAIRRSGPGVRADAFGVPRDQALTRRVGLDLEGSQEVRQSNGPLPWSWQDGVVTVDTPRSKVVIGSVKSGPFDLSGVTIDPKPNRQDWAAITLTSIEGDAIGSPGRILVTATGFVENTEMGWKDAEKTTVGRDWGKRPSLVEGVPATITLPVSATKVRAWALDERGGRQSEVKVRASGSKAVVEIGPAARTLWYEIIIIR
ncbi:MAG: carbohydrate binding domain-containing protein [Isosphaeraceae bacterium]